MRAVACAAAPSSVCTLSVRIFRAPHLLVDSYPRIYPWIHRLSMICLAHPFTSDVLPIEYCCCWLLREKFPPAMFQVAGFVVGGSKNSGGVCCTPFVVRHPLLSHTPSICPPFVLWHLHWPPFEVYCSHPPLFISCCRAVTPRSISFARC